MELPDLAAVADTGDIRANQGHHADGGGYPRILWITLFITGTASGASRQLSGCWSGLTIF